jgi:hypothetical protein
MLSGRLALHDLDEVERLASRAVDNVLRFRNISLSYHRREALLAYVIGEVWRASLEYDSARYRRFAILACTVAKRRAIDWRDRHSGKLVEIDMNPELPPIDEGDLGRFYTFARGEEVSADHEAVLDAPGAFEPVED